MTNMSEGYMGWGWFLWIGIWFLLISSFGSWGYTYRTHRRFRDLTQGKSAYDFLKERYSKGEISRDDFIQMKKDISEDRSHSKKVDAMPVKKNA